MAPQPLTHHEIFALVGPFTRRGHHVDLAATDRLGRRLAFKPIERSAIVPGVARLQERLTLDMGELGALRLHRTLECEDGSAAALEAEGPDPADLLHRIDSIPAQVHFRVGTDFAIVYDYRLAGGGEGEDGGGRASEAMMLVRATARTPKVSLSLAMPTVRGEPAKVELTASGTPLELPRDVLAVLGRDWSPLRDGGDVRRGTLKVRGREPSRRVRVEREFERAVTHLARTLAEAPGLFHERWATARWGVYLRCATPLLACLALIGATAALPRAHLSEHSALRMLLFNMPPLLMGMFFCLREIPRIEIPPVPRRSRAREWPAATQA